MKGEGGSRVNAREQRGEMDVRNSSMDTIGNLLDVQGILWFSGLN